MISLKKIFSGKNLLLFTVIGLIALFIAQSDHYIKTTFDGITIWAVAVLPSLLPFFFLTALLTKTQNLSGLARRGEKISRFLYKSSGISLYIRLMSIISGYPVGAKLIYDLKKSNIINKAQAEKYCTFTSTSGPLFIVGAVGISMFYNKLFGIIMLISHIISSGLVGIIFRKMPDNGLIAPLFDDKKVDAVLYDCIYQSIISVLIVGGFVAVFYTFSQMVMDLKILLPIEKLFTPIFGDMAKGFVYGLIECTRGAKLISSVSTGKLACATCEAIISFGGMSVWCQSLAYLKKAGVRVWVFALSKVLHTIISFLICYFLLMLI